MGNQLFDELIGTPPPSDVNVEAIMRRERRASAALRFGGSLAAVLALAVAGGVTVAVGDRNPGNALATPQAEATSSDADTRFRLVYDTKETADATAKRLGRELDNALRKAAPEAEWIRQPGLGLHGEARDPEGQLPMISGPGTMPEPGSSLPANKKTIGHDPLLFSAWSGVSTDGHEGFLKLLIRPDKFSDANPRSGRFTWSCQNPAEDGSVARTCEEAKAPTGMKMKISTIWWDEKKSSFSYVVDAQLPGSRVLSISVTNGFDGFPPAQPESPLSQTQVNAMAVYLAGKIKT